MKFRFFLQAIINGYPGSALDACYLGSMNELPDNWKTEMLKIKNVVKIKEFPSDAGFVEIVIWKFQNL